ncbi:MAG: stage II sporulation protein M [Clostridia bacterium]
MKHYFLNYIKENIKSIKIFSICILIGFVIGITLFNMVSIENKEMLIDTVKSSFDIVKNENFNTIFILQNGIINNIIVVVILLLISLTIIAPILICLFFLTKGFLIGLFSCILFSIFGFGNGIIAFLLVILLVNIIYIPAIIVLGIKSINFHYEIFESNNRFKSIVSLIYSIVICLSFMILSVIIEQMLYGYILNMFIK